MLLYISNPGKPMVLSNKCGCTDTTLTITWFYVYSYVAGRLEFYKCSGVHSLAASVLILRGGCVWSHLVLLLFSALVPV